MNKVEIVGRLTKDPAINDGNSKTARFSIAAQRSFKDKSGKYGADFINCVAFGKTAEIVEKHFHKGSLIGVIGRINTGSYTNKEGQKVYTTDVAVEIVEFIGSKSDSSSSSAAADDGDFMSIPDDAESEVTFA